MSVTIYIFEHLQRCKTSLSTGYKIIATRSDKNNESIHGLEAGSHSNLAQLPSAWLFPLEQHSIGEEGMVCQGGLDGSVVIGPQKIGCE